MAVLGLLESGSRHFLRCRRHVYIASTMRTELRLWKPWDH